MSVESIPDFTARNTWQASHNRPEQAKVDRYLKGSITTDNTKVEAIKKGRALREAMRMVRHANVEFDGTPWQRGCIRLLDQLIAVRDAPNAELLFARNDIAVGMIEGAASFGSITLQQCYALRDLRANAYQSRLAELSARWLT
jgi:hypothetical protein